MKNQQKGFALIVIVIVAVAVLALGTGAVFYYQKQKATPKSSDSTVLPQQETQPIASDKTNEKVYRNEKYGFTFSYPIDWKLKEVYDRTKEGVTYPSSLQNVIDSYVEMEKGGYVLRFEINNQGWSREASVSAKDYKSLVLKNGLKVWRTKNPELSEEGEIPFFQLGVLTPYTGNLQQYYDSNFSSIITHNGNLSFSIYYGFAKNVNAKNYDTNTVGVMDKIAESFSLTTTPVTTTKKESLATILGNLSYDFPNQGQTKLTNGLFSKKVEVCGNQSCNGIYYYVHLKLNEKIVVGDLNGDGVNDAIVLIDSGRTPSSRNENLKDENVEYTGQTVAAVVNQNGIYKNVAYAGFLSYDLSARTISIKNIEIKNNLIYVTVVKNEGSSSLIYPSTTETIQLGLEPASLGGFKIYKDGASELNSYAAPQIKNVTVAVNDDNKILQITGKDFSLLKNTVSLALQSSPQTRYFSVSIGLESSQNNSYIEIPLSTVGFMGLGGQADTPPFDIRYVPSGKYNVVVNVYRCPLKQSCQSIESNSFVIDIP